MNPFQSPLISDPEHGSRCRVVDGFVFVAIGIIIYGMTLPAVMTNCVGRSAVIQPLANP